MKKTISVTAPTREQAFDALIRFCWFKAQKYSDLGVDTTKCKLKDFTYICKVIIGVDEDNIDTIEEKALRIYEAITQINVCEDFACQKFIRGKRKSEKWVENLPIEYFVYYSNGERCKVSAMEIIKGKFDNGKPINPYRMKTMIVGSCNGLNDHKYYAFKKAVGGD